MNKLWLLGLLILLLVACGGGNSPNPSSNTWDSGKWDQATWQ